LQQLPIGVFATSTAAIEAGCSTACGSNCCCLALPAAAALDNRSAEQSLLALIGTAIHVEAIRLLVEQQAAPPRLPESELENIAGVTR
jgi:hypothetical protein